MNKPYDQEKWANRLANAKNIPYRYKIQAFGSVILKNGKYLYEKKYIYSEFVSEVQKWIVKDKTTVIVPVEGARESKGLVGFQVQMKNYDPMTVSEPYQWYIMKVSCRVPDNVKNVLLTKSYAFQLKSGSIINGGFHINEIDKEFSQKMSINKPNFKESGGQFGWIKRGKPKKSTVKEVLRLFNAGELLALFISEDWGRIGKTTKLG